ncbi:MAG: low-complexity protein [Okeania sp. SIO2F4]|uniref:pentapeptide repeat-containing protein n=1 Tax=Okeania sp. SIO2F4 TaxID=2607790 RepID=UPI00142BADC6|nr:pentapeptide repeat-containing protein [Okeania sp. SIO2F4]NES04696.1 low-complexity protein [Okeania sp. SIO2F4]
MQEKNLTRRNFSSCDIRKFNFKNSILTETNFTDAIAGIPKVIKVGLIVILLFLATVGGIILSYSGRGIGWIVSDNKLFVVEFGWITLTLIALFFIAVLLRVEFRGTIVFSTILFVSVLILVLALSPEVKSVLKPAASILMGFLTFIGVIAGFSFLVEISLMLEVIGSTNPNQTIFSGLGAVAIMLGIGCGNFMYLESLQQLVSSLFVSLSSLAIIVYVRQEALAGDKKYLFFKSLAIALCSMLGTNFRKADLTDANFIGAILGNTDFREANLTRTCWLNAKNLDKARVKGTYLENKKIRQLVLSGDGREQNFDGLDLQGCNLQHADLTDASFIGANLTKATLEGANLTRSKLVKTQLYATNLTNAILTGACIEDWAISLDTKLEGIKCEYIYMRLETKEDPDPWRKPDNRKEIFQDGDFTDFIAPIIKTQQLYQTQNVDPRKVAENYSILDIFHHEGVDPSAAAIAFQRLIEKYPESGLQVLSIEGRGNDKIHFQAQVSDDVNRSLLSQEYNEIYHQIKSGSYQDLLALLAGVAEKDKHIIELRNLLETALKQNRFYVQTYQETRNIEIRKGDYRETSVNDQGSYVEGDSIQDFPQPES